MSTAAQARATRATPEGRERFNSATRRWATGLRARQREVIQVAKDVPCTDCGQRFPPFVMDFDHRDPSTKSFNVGAALGLMKSVEAILVEIAKCDVVCANCHRIRTHS